MFMKSIVLAAFLLFAASGAFAQEPLFISPDDVENIPEVQQAQRDIRTVVEGWKSELNAYSKQIDELDLEIRKNKLLWSDAERIQKEKDLAVLKSNYEANLKQKFDQGGEYEQLVTRVMKPLEKKIFAVVCLRLFFPALFIGR